MKYGFVYIWYDRKHRRYYIGCHWGTEDDGYICSSPWMKQSYKRRPKDFKRRILTKIFTNKKDMFEEEVKWQNLIKDHELKNKYYNIRRHGDKHWSTDNEKTLLLSEKISNTMRKKHKDPEYRELYMQGRQKATKSNKERKRSNEFKQRASFLAKNRSNETLKKISENSKRLQAAKLIGMSGKRHSEETRRKQSEAARNRPLLVCPHCSKTTRTLTNFNRWHNDRCRYK